MMIETLRTVAMVNRRGAAVWPQRAPGRPASARRPRLAVGGPADLQPLVLLNAVYHTCGVRGRRVKGLRRRGAQTSI